MDKWCVCTGVQVSCCLVARILVTMFKWNMLIFNFFSFFFLQIKASGTCILKYFQKTNLSLSFWKLKCVFGMIDEIIWYEASSSLSFLY